MAGQRGPNPDAGKRVVLRGADVLALGNLGGKVDIEAIDAVLKHAAAGEDVNGEVLQRALGEAGHTRAWLEVQTVDEREERKSIEAVAGKPNTTGAKPGLWKSVPLTNWKGTANYERPPEPLVGLTWTDD